jgi:hypothetical protein
MFIWIFLPNFLGFGFKARGLRDTCQAYFLNSLEDKERRFKTNLILSLLHSKPRGLLDMECDFHCTPYKRRFKTTRGMSTSQPRSS